MVKIKEDTLICRVSIDEGDKYRDLADKQGVTISEWLRKALKSHYNRTRRNKHA